MDHRLPFLGGPLPPGFRRWSVTLAPGETLPYAEDDWRDALVTVTEGRIEVECLAGGHAVFGAGSMVWMVGLELRAIHNRGDEPAVMVAVARAVAGASP
jgi:quercetin dioxygenase-like cupin family protein